MRRPVATVHSAGDAFGQAASPDVFSIALSAASSRGQACFSFEPPPVHHLPLAIPSPEVRHDAIRARARRGPETAPLVALLQARSGDKALKIARRLTQIVTLDDPQRPFVDRVLEFVFEGATLPARWGADPVADWLRAQRLEELNEGESWLGILAWLGRHAQHWFRAPEVLDEMPLAAAALATMEGLPRTLVRVSAMLRQARRTKDGAALLRVLILRCALEGVFDPESLRRGIVPTPRRGGEVAAEGWKPLLLARLALMEAGHVVGAAHLTAALVATDVRRGVMGELRLHGLQARIPAWGSRSLEEKEAHDLYAILHGRQVRKSALAKPLPSAPWPAEWGGPDTHEVTRALRRLIGGDRWLARDVFLHDGLALAAIHALGGHRFNAMAALGASRTPGVLEEARTALARAIHVGILDSTLPEDLPSKQADAVLRQLRELPEPNLALETPYGSLWDQRAEAQHAFQTSGRFQEFRRLRLVLDRPDLAEALTPFWVLPDRDDLEGSLLAFVRRTIARLEPPTADECGRFLRSIE